MALASITGFLVPLGVCPREKLAIASRGKGEIASFHTGLQKNALSSVIPQMILRMLPKRH